ncbi:hypothetical protein [Achromobacter dolens]
MSTEKIWFVTGAAGGLGLALVRMLLDQGGATSRRRRTTWMY